MTFIASVDGSYSSAVSSGSHLIARLLGMKLVEISCAMDPNENISPLVNSRNMVQLIGDVAMLQKTGVSWLEVVSAWKQPLILVVSPNSSGEIPGIAAAYVSLCKEFSTNLIGLIQLGSHWNDQQRILDCLPWCTHIPDEFLLESCVWDDFSLNSLLLVEDIGFQIKKSISYSNFKSH